MKRDGNKVYYEEGDLIFLRESYRLALVKCKEYVKICNDAENCQTSIAKDCEVVAVL